LNINAGNEFNQAGSVFLNKPKTRASVNIGIIVREIKIIMKEQAGIISEGGSLMANFEDCPKNQQIERIICWLNKELQYSSERLEELIAHVHSA
jgi:hypothetical protein